MEERMFDYTSTYLRMNQKPWFPIMGEFHYSRYQDEFWEEELRKIQAGGVSHISAGARLILGSRRANYRNPNRK